MKFNWRNWRPIIVVVLILMVLIIGVTLIPEQQQEMVTEDKIPLINHCRNEEEVILLLGRPADSCMRQTEAESDSVSSFYFPDRPNPKIVKRWIGSSIIIEVWFDTDGRIWLIKSARPEGTSQVSAFVNWIQGKWNSLVSLLQSS